MPSVFNVYFVILSLVQASISHSSEESPDWPSFRSFLQLGIEVAGIATLGTAFLPPQMQGLAGPLVSIATAKANAKKGISNVFTGGEDYPWVCTCQPFPAFARTVKDTRKCPYDEEMGCFAGPP